MWFCSECGKKNNGKYCTRCGMKYVEVDNAPPLYEAEDRYGMMAEGATETDAVAEDANEAEEFYNAAALFRRDNDGMEIPSLESYVDIDGEGLTEEETAPAAVDEADAAGAEADADEDPVAEDVVAVGEDVCAAEPVLYLEEEREPTLWSAPFLRHPDPLAEKDNGAVDYLRKTGGKEVLAGEEGAESPVEEHFGIAGIFSHRKPPENNADREWKLSKRLMIAVGAVGGVVCLAFLILVASLLVDFSKEEEVLPVSTGIYYYVSGGKEETPLYADKSIKSDVLAELQNGDAVEFLDAVNSRFTFVYDEASEQYGYVKASHLVKHEADVDYGNVENKYADEKSLGYFYVTKVEQYLNLWENPDGGGVVKAKLENGFKVSLLEKTNDKYWYVFDYNSAERGYVRTAYLTDSKSKVVGLYKEPKDKTVIGEYYVTGVKNYLPVYSKPNTGGDVRGKLNNDDKVGLIQKTTGAFWYVSGNGVYGWVSTKYLTATPPAAETPEPAPTPEPTPAPAPTPAPDTSMDYKVTNTQEYLPVLSEPKVGGAELGQIHNGDTVTLIKEHDAQFWYVKVPSLGIEGYVAKDYLTK